MIRHVSLLAPVAFVLMLSPDAYAGVGGLFRSAGKIPTLILVGDAILLLPFILYVIIREALEVSRTKKDLARLAVHLPHFAWAGIERTARHAVTVLHENWTSGDLSACSDVMTPAYAAGQQDLLDRWAEEGRRNVVQLHRVGSIRPLFLDAGGDDRPPFVWVAVKLSLVDYLEDRATGKIRKGKKSREDEEILYQMLFTEEGWKVNAIEEGSSSLVIASKKNEVDFERFERSFGGESRAAAANAAEHDAAAQGKQADVSVADR